jgi:hypothetical protein
VKVRDEIGGVLGALVRGDADVGGARAPPHTNAATEQAEPLNGWSLPMSGLLYVRCGGGTKARTGARGSRKMIRTRPSARRGACCTAACALDGDDASECLDKVRGCAPGTPT